MNILASLIFASIYQWTVELPSSLYINFYDQQQVTLDFLATPGTLKYDDVAQTFDADLQYEETTVSYHTGSFTPNDPNEPERFNATTGELRVFDVGSPYIVGDSWNVKGDPYPAFLVFLENDSLRLSGYFRDGNTEGYMGGNVTYNGAVAHTPEPASLLLLALGLLFFKRKV